LVNDFISTGVTQHLSPPELPSRTEVHNLFQPLIDPQTGISTEFR